MDRFALGSSGGRNRVTAVAALVVVVALVAVTAFVVVGRSGNEPSPTPPPSTGSSPMDEALRGVAEDGTYSKETALAVFAAAFGPLPGVPTPRVDTSYHSGTLAIQMVMAHWSELTDEQRAAIRGYVGPSAATTLPAAFHPLALDTYQGIANVDATDIATRFGRPLGIPITVITGAPKDPGGAWAWAHGNWEEVSKGSTASQCTIVIPDDTANDRSRDQYMRWVLMHEVWHCFEYTMVNEDGLKASPPWVIEGEASFAAESVTGGQGAPPPEFTNWQQYVEDPGKPLYSRVYDAIGFYAQLDHAKVDVWKVLEPMMRAGSSDAAFQQSGGAAASFADRWGSSWFRDGQPTVEWAMTTGDGIPSPTYRAKPKDVQIVGGSSDTISAKPNAGAVAAVHTVAFVTEFEVSGAGRVSDPAGGGIDRVVRAGILDLCTSLDGTCTCPPGSARSGPEPDRAPQNLHAAVTGEPHNLSVMDIRGISETDWCKPQASPPASSGCKSGCGGSNGDPHLKTLDGTRYDLQAAGEYVLLRAADDSVEIQARQEPPCMAGGGPVPTQFKPSCQATINTAAAVRVNGHRVGFYAAGDVPAVRIDGQPVDAGAIASADLGSGATLAGYRRGYELGLPDGTRVWILSIGSFGINILVKPSTSLFASGVGLIAQVPTTAATKVPALPDGSTLPAAADQQDRHHLLYDVFAPAWRVSDATTLFDYEPGKTAASFGVPGFPPPDAPPSTQELDAATLAQARSACSTVTDADLADQCAYDTAVTGDTRFATLYQASEQLETVGPSTLDLAPGASPAPTTQPGSGTASGVNLVEDHLSNLGSFGIGPHALGPDGTVYVEVAEAGASFGDSKTVLLAVDAATGKVRQRVTPDRGGPLVYAAGSLWADGFTRHDTGCMVSRLDPVTLAVQADVATVCADGVQTVMAPFDGAVWFLDRTGADADGKGAHLRRIDPATNAVDPASDGSLELPVVAPYLGIFGTNALLVPTSAGLIIGDPQHGYHRLTAGSTAFEPLGNPGSGYRLYPAGRGVWTQSEIGTLDDPQSTAVFYDGGDTASRQLTVQLEVIAADDDAVYTDYAPDDAEADGLWRNPVDGSPPSRIATSAFEPNSTGGTTRLTYQDPVAPIMVGDGVLVKLWVALSSADIAQVALYVQSIPVP